MFGHSRNGIHRPDDKNRNELHRVVILNLALIPKRADQVGQQRQRAEQRNLGAHQRNEPDWSQQVQEIQRSLARHQMRDEFVGPQQRRT